MSEEMSKMDETFNKIFQILVDDELTPAEHLVVLAKLIVFILKLGESSGRISKETMLQAKIKIATTILDS
jgi:hypothetical protein